jgi:hypothetical protein
MLTEDAGRGTPAREIEGNLPLFRAGDFGHGHGHVYVEAGGLVRG